MSFHDLPTNHDDLDFRDPTLGADLVDLLLGDRDRVRDSLLLLPCFPDGRLVSTRTIVINDVPWAEGPRQIVRLWSTNDEEIRHGVALILATSHRGLGVPEVHRDWLTGATEGITALGTSVIGAYVAAGDAVHRVDARVDAENGDAYQSARSTPRYVRGRARPRR